MLTHSNLIFGGRSSTNIHQMTPNDLILGVLPMAHVFGKRRAEALYGVAAQNGYGMTDTTAGVTLASNAIGVPDISAGVPLPGVELRLRNIGPDGVGKIQTRGPHVMLGHFRNPDATAAMFDTDGFLCTGDRGGSTIRGDCISQAARAN